MNKKYYKINSDLSQNEFFEMVKSKREEIDKLVKLYVEQHVADKLAMALMAFTISPKKVNKYKILPYNFSLKSTFDGIFDVVIMETEFPIAKILSHDSDYYIYAENDIASALSDIFNIGISEELDELDINNAIGFYIGMEDLIEKTCIPNITVGDIHNQLLTDKEYLLDFQTRYKYTPKDVDTFLYGYNRNLKDFYSKFR